MSNQTLTGTMTALITPLRDDGEIAWNDLEALVERQVSEGIDGLVPVGTTGESPTLSHDEHIAVVRKTVEIASGRVPVVAGAGSNSTREAVSLAQHADRAGADALLLVAPYYNKPTQAGLLDHFSRVADATEKPIVLYSIPGRCGIEIEVDTVARLRERYAHVAWIKEAGGSVARVDALLETCGDAVTILSGDDGLTLPFCSVGAQGVISVASNLVVADLVQLVKSAREGDLATARRLHRRYHRLFRDLFIESSPAPIKAAMAWTGRIGSPRLRAPLAPLSNSAADVLADTLTSLDYTLDAR